MSFGALTFPRCVHDTAPQTGSCCSLSTAACKYARDKKLQEKQKKLNSLPPILRPKNEKSRELAAVAHFQQKICPRRFVDTDKLNRKEWSRIEVALNPFLYGKKDEMTMVRQSPLKTVQSNDDPDESLDGAVSFPQSLSAAFGNSPDVPDGGPPEQTSDRELHFGQGVWNGAQDEGRGVPMLWQRHLVSRNPRKSGPRKNSLIPRLRRRRKELHLNLSNTDILHHSYSSHLSSRDLARYATLQSRCSLTIQKTS